MRKSKFCFPKKLLHACMVASFLFILESCLFQGNGKTPPAHFSFQYFDSLPHSEIIPKAQEFLDERFPKGSNLQNLIKELVDAGAKCAGGQDQLGIYYGCSYDRTVGITMPFVNIEWRVRITPNRDQTDIEKIFVNRGLTGL
jgi:hypothetical protein